jgi:uncharacterized tellurite resistance protein B-like protein
VASFYNQPGKLLKMFESVVTTQDQALAHLLFHCCLKDGRFDEAEIDKVSEIFVDFGLQHDLNFTDEVRKYRSYVSSIQNEQAYIDHLVDLLMPVNELAIFSWCIELALSDDTISVDEEALLAKIAESLNISSEENAVIHKLMVQRRVVLTQKIC